MGRVNPWLEQQIAKRRNPALPPSLGLILEAESDELVPEVESRLARLPGVSVTGSALNFTRVVAPPGMVERIALVPGLKVVSYDAPAYIRAAPSLLDPLLGAIRLSPIEIPLGPGEALLHGALNAFRTPLGLLATTAPRIFGQGPSRPDIVIVPTGETREWTGVPSDDNRINTKVAVIDTGVAYPHVLLHPTKGFLGMYSTTGEPPQDLLGHGVWCICTAFGDSFRTRFGLCQGVADPQNGNLMSVKALSNLGFGSTWSVLQAMELAYKKGAKIVSMSLGGPLQGSVTEDPQCVMVERLKNEVIFVVAAGNSGPDEWTIGSPGASPFAVTVGAWSTHHNGLALFSSRGPSGEFYNEHPDVYGADLAHFGEDLVKPDCVAPGGGPVEEGQKTDMIYSGCVGWTDGMNDLTPGDGFDAMRGTSMSTPAVAGLLAYAYDRGMIRTAQDVKRKLAAGQAKNHRVGYGLIDLAKLV